MYEYAFVTLPAQTSYQDEIVRHAAEGWRLVQVLTEAPADGASGYTLIFERPQTVSTVS